MSEPSEVDGGIPVFKPTMDEFEDFEKYVGSIKHYGLESGIIKIIPPSKWLEEVGSVDPAKLALVKVQNPIRQMITGSNGLYYVQNVEKQRSYNMIEWYQLAERFLPPKVEAGKKFESSAANGESGGINEMEQFIKNILQSEDMNNLDEEILEKLEDYYWKSLHFQSETMYGADMPGSIFPSSLECFNVSKLPDILTKYMEQKLPGVNTAYLYAGLWKSSFPWHLEDQDLYSINYLHFGKPKQWYSIPQKHQKKFEAYMIENFHEDYKNCDEFLRHKLFMCSPKLLKKQNIQVNKITHYANEFIITFPYGYHSGFNYGYNLAESVNFALDDWLVYGKLASRCFCINDSVYIDVDKLIGNIGQSSPGKLNAMKELSLKFKSENDDTDEINAKLKQNKRIGKGKGKIRKSTKSRIEITKKSFHPCLICDRLFTSSNDLFKHQSLIHPK